MKIRTKEYGGEKMVDERYFDQIIYHLSNCINFYNNNNLQELATMCNELVKVIIGWQKE